MTLPFKRTWVAGHTGMVGSALVRRLEKENCEVLTVPRKDLDLRHQKETEEWIVENKPDAIILAAAKVGGITANDSAPADFLYENLAIQTNVIHGAYKAGVRKLLFLGSSCIYPRDAPQPIPESALLSGPLEKTNEAYAIAKIAGLKMCAAYRKQYGCDFISAMPCNLYGSRDTYDLQKSHVIPALILKMIQAKESGDDHVEIWGTGTPLREFLHVDDLAGALVFLLKNYSDDTHINVGSGKEISIADLAALIAEVTGFQGELHFNTDYPDGTPRKLMDSSRLFNMGWRPRIKLREGLEDVYRDLCANPSGLRAA